MIQFFHTKNSLVKNYLAKFSSLQNVEEITSLDAIKSNSTIVFFFDSYLDIPQNILENVNKILLSDATNIIYLDTVEIYGFTDKGSVDESYRHIPLTQNGKIRKEIYQLLQKNAEENLTRKIILLRLPDLLAPGANFFLNSVLSGKSNIIQWPGSTAINHEFIFVSDAIDVLKSVIEWAEKSSDSGKMLIEFNISGTKYTLEQIAAAINEITGVLVKIVRYNTLFLFLQQFFVNKNKINYAKNIIDVKYLFDKPIFLNSAKYEFQFGEIKKTELYNGLYDIFNG